MKPNDWDKMTDEDKKDIAIKLFSSMRGQLIIGQALFKAIEAMKKEAIKDLGGLDEVQSNGQAMGPDGILRPRRIPQAHTLR